MVIGIWRDRTAKKVAAAHGLELDTTRYQAPTSYALLAVGSKRSTRCEMKHPAGGASIFDFGCVVTESDARTDDDQLKPKRFTCAIVDVPFVAPHTLLRRESFGSQLLASVGGSGDIEIGIADFDKRYELETVDEAFARTLLVPDVVSWVLRGDDVGKSMSFEFLGNKLLCMSKGRSVDDFPVMLEWAMDFLRLTPPELVTSYPRTTNP